MGPYACRPGDGTPGGLSAGLAFAGCTCRGTWVRREALSYSDPGASTGQQASGLCLTLRRAADLLGSTNDPLTEDPAAKPYVTESGVAAK